MVRTAELRSFRRRILRFTTPGRPGAAAACYVALWRLPRPDFHRLVIRTFPRRTICVLDGSSKEPFSSRHARESDDVRMTCKAARSDATGGPTRTAIRETLRPFSANRPGDPNARMSPGQHDLCEEARVFRISRQAARWPRHRLRRPHLVTPARRSKRTQRPESPTSSTEMRAQAPDQSDRSDRARQLQLLGRGRAAVRAKPDLRRDTAEIGTSRNCERERGFIDGSCRELTRPAEGKPPQRAAIREC